MPSLLLKVHTLSIEFANQTSTATKKILRSGQRLSRLKIAEKLLNYLKNCQLENIKLWIMDALALVESTLSVAFADRSRKLHLYWLLQVDFFLFCALSTSIQTFSAQWYST